jgi:hypothetical protein
MSFVPGIRICQESSNFNQLLSNKASRQGIALNYIVRIGDTSVFPR